MAQPVQGDRLLYPSFDECLLQNTLRAFGTVLCRFLLSIEQSFNRFVSPIIDTEQLDDFDRKRDHPVFSSFTLSDQQQLEIVRPMGGITFWVNPFCGEVCAGGKPVNCWLTRHHGAQMDLMPEDRYFPAVRVFCGPDISGRVYGRIQQAATGAGS